MNPEDAKRAMQYDPTYVMSEIEANPIWKEAFRQSELHNGTAPIGWGKYIPVATQTLFPGGSD